MTALEGAFVSGAINTATAFTSEISNYFNAEFYHQNGFQDSIALTQSVFFPEPGQTQYEVKEISQVEVQLYDFKLLDTSNIDIINFGENIDNYQVLE